MKKRAFVVLSLLAFIHISWSFCCADNAEVLPKGVSRIALNGKFYLPIDERYGPGGDTEMVYQDYNDDLNSAVFPALSLIEAGFGMPAGSASIGRSAISFEYDATVLECSYHYGLTDRLSLGVMVPYWWFRTSVKARLDASGATVGSNPLFGSPADPFMGSPLVPIALGGVPLTTDQAQDLIGAGLDVNGDGTAEIPGYGYKRIKSWSQNAISDIEAGLRYQYYKSPDWRLAFTGGVRFPTGELDDPDNLMDYPFGRGAWALLFHFNHDYTGIPNLVLNATLRYELYLPDEETRRVPGDVNQPITANQEKVDRDLGDVIELEASGTYELSPGLSLSLLYKYGFGLKDDISGDRGFSYRSLEDETDYAEHVVIAGISYSTLPLYQAKRFPVPLTASLSYRNRFAGENNTLKSQYIGLGLQVYF